MGLDGRVYTLASESRGTGFDGDHDRVSLVTLSPDESVDMERTDYDDLGVFDDAAMMPVASGLLFAHTRTVTADRVSIITGSFVVRPFAIAISLRCE